MHLAAGGGDALEEKAYPTVTAAVGFVVAARSVRACGLVARIGDRVLGGPPVLPRSI